MMSFIFRVVALSAVIFFMPRFLPGLIIADIKTAVIFTLILVVVNMFLKPIVSFITAPINILTLGLLGLVVNGALFLVVGKFISGVSIDGFVTAFLAALVISAVNFVVSKV